MNRTLAFTLCVALVLPPSSVLAEGPEPADGSAEEGPGLAVGARVRVTAPALAWELYRRRGKGRFVAMVLSVDDQSITLAAERRKGPVVVPLSSVERLEVSRSPSAKMNGVLVGFLAGTAISIGLIAANRGTASCDSTTVSTCDLILGAILMGLPGAVIGGATAPGEQWEEVGVDEPPVRIGVGLAPGGGVGFSARWSFGSSPRAPRRAPERAAASSAMGPPAPASRHGAR